jgi:5-(aminomethyl)-3-furanmethanol phosphate kinase
VSHHPRPSEGAPAAIDVVIKVGGALMRDPVALQRTMADLSRAPRETRWLIVPGGGPFADAVRDLDRRLPLTDDAAHWMAILAMDQYAHVLAGLVDDSLMVHDPAGIAAALEAGRIPVLAPYRWLRCADPLPHSWDVTSDSIAAWIAVALGAPHLLLLKPVVGPLADVVDAQFAPTLATARPRPPSVHHCTAADAAQVIAELAARRQAQPRLTASTLRT